MFKINHLCGYTSNESPMRAEKINQSINNKRVRFTPVGDSVETVGNFSEWIINSIFEGFSPAENIIEYGHQYVYYNGHREREWRKYDTPKAEYVLKNVDRMEKSLQLNKSQYKFAVWVVENFSTLDEAIQADKDYAEKLRIAEEKKQQEEAAKQEEEIRIKAEKEEYRQHCLSEAEKLLDTNIAELYYEVFRKAYGENNRCTYNSGPMLYVCTAEIDNPLAKDMLIHWLHNGNKASIKFVEAVSGVKLPKTYKARVECINLLSAENIKLIQVVKN